ncbi:MAG: glycosyltransferase family 2 protein [Chloroflexi bacterium]|nr:MAG: glycosyltransferase family 2 protein [Chloroflexota bacterium]
MRISVVVINYNGERHLAQLIDALQAQTLRDFEFIFIDNASVDGSVALVERLCAQGETTFTLIANPKNVGFAPACNQGFRLAQGSWVALLNNDAFPEPDWLEHLWAATQGGSRLGMIAAKMLFAHAPDRINSAGIAIDRVGIAWDWRGGEKDTPNEQAPIEIFGPCGGAALYSAEMLDEIGLFDEDFFLYLEDVDLAWRAQLAGWRCVLEPKARVYHVHSATFGNASPFKSYLLGRNKVWLIIKNYPSPWLLVYLPVILGYDLMSVIVGTIRSRNFSALQGRLAALRQLPHFLRKRRQIQAQPRSGDNWQTLMAPLALPSAVLKRYAHLR